MPDPVIRLKNTTASKKKGIFTAKVEWEVQVEIPATTTAGLADQIMGAVAGLPREGTAYPGYALATCRGIEAGLIDPGIYSFSAEYSDENSIEDNAGTDENPLNDRPKVDRNGSIENRSTHRNRNNKAILNTAGDPIPQTYDDNRLSFSVSANIAVDSELPDLLLTSYRNSCNVAEIIVDGITIPAEAARIILSSGWLSSIEKRNDTYYRVLKFELLIDERDLHYATPLNAGFRELRAIPGTSPVQYEQVEIVGDDGTDLTDPRLLDADGAALPTPVDPDNSIFLSEPIYRTRDYTVLPGVAAVE